MIIADLKFSESNAKAGINSNLFPRADEHKVIVRDQFVLSRYYHFSRRRPEKTIHESSQKK